MKTIQTVAIIGAGTQGAMLAFRALAFGKNASIFSRREQSRLVAAEKILMWLEDWEQQGRLGNLSAKEAFGRLRLAASLDDALEGCDLIIENIPEVLEDKQAIWQEIDRIALPDALLSTNSSSLTASAIGIHVARKEKTFNVNFMTPTQDDMVEVMWNVHTSEETKAMALGYLRELDHVPVVTKKEIKGLSLNRVWRAIKRESLMLWAQGYTTPEDLDRAWMLEWGTAHGPFGLMDKVGLDIVEQIENSYYAESRRPEDRPPAALTEMVQQGFLGEKSGKGFYDYPNPAYTQASWLRGEEES